MAGPDRKKQTDQSDRNTSKTANTCGDMYLYSAFVSSA